MNCREASLMISRGELEDASGLRRWRAWAHLLICRFCRRYRRELAALALAARVRAEGLLTPAARADFETRLLRRLRA